MAAKTSTPDRLGHKNSHGVHRFLFRFLFRKMETDLLADSLGCLFHSGPAFQIFF